VAPVVKYNFCCQTAARGVLLLAGADVVRILSWGSSRFAVGEEKMTVLLAATRLRFRDDFSTSSDRKREHAGDRDGLRDRHR